MLTNKFKLLRNLPITKLIPHNFFSQASFSTRLEKSFPAERFFEVEDKTGLIFTLEDKPGVLLEALKVFSKYGVNLTYINSRPS